MRSETLKMLSLLLFILTASGCVRIPNIRACSSLSTLADGASCAETLTGKETEMTIDEYIIFLEPNEEEARAGAVCMSAFDFKQYKTALELACRLLGPRCVK